MNVESFIEKLTNVFEDTDISTLSPETAFRDIEEWDSLTALSLIAMVDEEYSLKLTGDDIKKSITIKDLFDKVNLK